MKRSATRNSGAISLGGDAGVAVGEFVAWADASLVVSAALAAPGAADNRDVITMGVQTRKGMAK